MYYSCHCIKRNGLQHDCRRTGCGGEPACLTQPDPVCAPSQLARQRGLADVAPFAGHYHAQGGGGAGAGGPVDSSGGGKRFIVCELKGILPDVATNHSEKCCKCNALSTSKCTKVAGVLPTTSCPTHAVHAVPPNSLIGSTAGICCVSAPPQATTSRCPCSSDTAKNQALFVFDEQTLESIKDRFESKELTSQNTKWSGFGGRNKKPAGKDTKEECTRPGCLHWQPPPPCVWDLPCKADCFEAHPGIQPGRNLLRHGGGRCVFEGSGATENFGSLAGGGSEERNAQPRERMKLLTPACCTPGCNSAGAGGAAGGGGAPAAGLPVLVMKLC